MKSSFNFLWEVLNNSYGVVIGAESLSLLTILVICHIFLAIITLCLGDRTICDILRPLRKIFQPDAESLCDGVIGFFVAIPNAICYYVKLYIKVWVLALRISFVMLLAMLASVFFLMLLLIIFNLVLGEEAVMQSSALAQFTLYFHYICTAYCFWRIDGRQLATNFRNAWRC